MNQSANGGKSATWVWVCAVVLFVIHQDFWFWDDATLVFGFMPIGLAYHAVFSIAATVLWACAVKFAWPAHIEHWADQSDGHDEQETP